MSHRDTGNVLRTGVFDAADWSHVRVSESAQNIFIRVYFLFYFMALTNVSSVQVWCACLVRIGNSGVLCACGRSHEGSTLKGVLEAGLVSLF